MSYGAICSLCLPLLAIWTSPKAKLSTVDCLEADNYVILLLQDSMKGPEKLCKQAMDHMRVTAVLNTVDAPS